MVAVTGGGGIRGKGEVVDDGSGGEIEGEERSLRERERERERER